MDKLLGWISPELVAKQVGWNATNDVVITNKPKQASEVLIQVGGILLYLSLTYLPFRSLSHVCVILSSLLIRIPKCHLHN